MRFGVFELAVANATITTNATGGVLPPRAGKAQTTAGPEGGDDKRDGELQGGGELL